jgi:hypothetical protein
MFIALVGMFPTTELFQDSESVESDGSIIFSEHENFVDSQEINSSSSCSKSEIISELNGIGGESNSSPSQTESGGIAIPDNRKSTLF